MRKPTETPREPLSAGKMLYNLSRVKPALLKMQPNEKDYAPLIGVIQTLDPEAKGPTGKAIQQQLGIGAAVYRRWLEMLYQDFMALIAVDADVLQFTDVEHVFYVGREATRMEVRCRLAVTPRVGETVELHFLSAFLEEGSFQVTRVDHEYVQGKTLIHVSLEEGNHDVYFKHLLARARFENKWPRDAWEMHHYQQRELLLKLYPKG